MRKILLLLTSLILIPFTSATTASEITLLDQHGYMPSSLFMFIAVVTMATIILAYKWLDDMCAIISVAAGFVMLWTSRSIDYVTGIAIDSTSTIVVVHTVYKPDIISLFAGICFVLALLNAYRLYVLSKATV